MATPFVPYETQAEERFKQKLLELGLLAEVKPPAGRPEGNRTPVQVKGRPISRTIIKERR